MPGEGGKFSKIGMVDLIRLVSLSLFAEKGEEGWGENDNGIQKGYDAG